MPSYCVDVGVRPAVSPPARRGILIVNRRSRQGGVDLSRSMATLARWGFALRRCETTSAEEVGKVIREQHAGADCVIVAGGDGTLSAAAEALCETGLPLGILPLGTANDLARTLAIPTDLTAAMEVIAAGRTKAVSVAEVNGAFFFNVASIGLGAAVTRHLSTKKKRRWGVLAFIPAVRHALRENRSFGATITCDGRACRLHAIQIAVGNGRHYGGGLVVAEDAEITDDEFSVYALEPQGWLSLLRLIPSLWRGGQEGRPKVQMMRCREVVLETGQPMPVDVDGELRATTPAHFHLLPHAVQVYVP